MAKKNKTSKKDKRTARKERRFAPQSAVNPLLVGGLGALTAMLLGAGFYAFLYAQSFASDEKLARLPSYLIAAGAVFAGITIWIGTSSESAIRVGAPGIAVEKGDVLRMPWWAVEKLTFDSSALAVIATGQSEAGSPLVIKVPVKAHPDAAGWVVKEARERIPRRVDIDENLVAELPAAREGAGEVLDLEPLQVVGKKCAATGKTISYEPDARVCARCERVYIASAVPKKCKCGSSLAHLRPKGEEDGAEDEIESGADSTREPVES